MAIFLPNVGSKMFGTSYTQQQIKVMEKTASLTLKRDNDIFLNEQFLTKGYPKSQLVLINWCWLYLQVTTQSDITSGDGCYLLSHITQCHNPLQHYSSLQWPRQEYSSEKAWLLWRKAIQQCFPTNTQGRLREPLGKLQDYDTKWGLFFDSSTTSLFVRGSRWMRFQSNTKPSRETTNDTSYRIISIHQMNAHTSLLLGLMIGDNWRCMVHLK